ncbi:MAG: phosphotransferase family protein [Egibacteraceae bacterium]
MGSQARHGEMGLHQALQLGADRFGVSLAGEPVYGFGGERSIGCRVSGPEGERWLRIVSEPARWAQGEYWEGNADAAEITAVAKPAWFGHQEWDRNGCRVRAELMTFIAAPVCSLTPELRTRPELPTAWWDSLRRSLDALAARPTQRIAVSQDLVARRLLGFFGDRLDARVTAWSTSHGDLHWANLTAPACCLLDWEGWGLAPAGYDVAMLYCASLLQPDVAREVYEVFADLLDAPEGQRAQLCAIAHLLLRVNYGHHTDLAGPLHRHATRPLTTHRGWTAPASAARRG